MDDKSTIDECTSIYENFGSALTQQFFTTRKLFFQSNTAIKQINEYQDQLSAFGKETDDVTNEIINLESNLQEETINKQHREECEAISKVITSFPSRSETQKEINQLHEELNKLEQEEAAIESEVDLRSKQFQLLLFAVNELSQILGIDNTLEEGEVANSPISFPSKRESNNLPNPTKRQKL